MKSYLDMAKFSGILATCLCSQWTVRSNSDRSIILGNKYNNDLGHKETFNADLNKESSRISAVWSYIALIQLFAIISPLSDAD
ncbi:hypothetical protein [Photorhabdus sp. SF281]|uniref:hypothetical protein n=1 Tax=Photorhabdus sp. SF281 TaxID=3459527 RepID=UPI00404518A7